MSDRLAANRADVTSRGPIVVAGTVRVQAADGRILREDEEVALCRCGQSKNKPFCDGSHNDAAFADPGVCAQPQPVVPIGPGALTVNVITKGPLMLAGPLELRAADGAVIYSGEKVWLCRCGSSQTKPFCDGTHKKIGFAG